MKLYTEEQVREMMQDSFNFGDKAIDYAVSRMTPIELPSDEEIKKESHSHYMKGQLYIEPASDTEYAFKKGAKWIRNKLTNTK